MFDDKVLRQTSRAFGELKLVQQELCEAVVFARGSVKCVLGKDFEDSGYVDFDGNDDTKERWFVKRRLVSVWIFFGVCVYIEREKKYDSQVQQRYHEEDKDSIYAAFSRRISWSKDAFVSSRTLMKRLSRDD